MPGPVYLLDTNIILNLVRANRLGQYIAATFDLTNAEYRPMVSIVSHGELWVMAEFNGWGKRKRTALEKALSNLITIELDSRAVVHAYVEVHKVSRGLPAGARTMSNNDSWIAASAVLLTTDKDFLPSAPGTLPGPLD